MKKIFKILTILILFCLAVIVIIPIVFEDKIIDLVKQTINNNVNATFDFEEADLSLWSSFPSAEVSLKKISLVNKEPFAGDTLFSAATIDLKMPFKDIFKTESEGINITNFAVDEAIIAIKIDSSGNANYNITIDKNDKGQISNNNASTFELGLQSYNITNSVVSYNDASGKLLLRLTDLNHSGTGNLSSVTSELKTTTSSSVSLQLDSIAYLNENKITLDAILGIDLKENKYSFLENKATINELPLIFDGFVKQNQNDQEVAITFKTPSSDFKNFLALIPKHYSKNIEGVTTTGNFDVKGKIEGTVDETHIPRFNILINSDNASFKYPDLPKSLKNININTEIANATGLPRDTYANINKLSFKIDEEVFNANAKLLNISENMKVTASLKGIIDLASLEKIYPAEGVKGIKGILDLDATTSFDMNSIKNHHYENTKTSGKFSVANFKYESKELNSPLEVKKARITFNPKTVNLNTFDATLGKTDIIASGSINNILGFIFADKNLEGKFNVISNTFSVNDFMVTEIENNETDEITKPTTSKERIKIPSFLDCAIDAKAKTVLYDDITLRDVTGTLIIKDQKAALRNMRSNVFDGALGFNGEVSTKEAIPSFTMDLDIKQFNITESFTTLDLLKALAPIASVIDGKINSKISLSGNLKDDFTPDLNSLSGNLLAELLSSKISSEKAPLLQSLEQNLSFFDSKKLNLDDLKTAVTFKDGKVAIKPFNLNYDDIEIVVSGGHNFDTSLAYDAVINVPAKYLGKEASQLLAQLNDEELSTIKVPVNALISGKFNSPNVKTDLKSAVTNLSKQLANKQKDKLVEKGTEEVANVLDDLLSGKKKQKDSTATDTIKKDAVKDVAKDILGNIFGKKKKKKDTVN